MKKRSISRSSSAPSGARCNLSLSLYHNAPDRFASAMTAVVASSSASRTVAHLTCANFVDGFLRLSDVIPRYRTSLSRRHRCGSMRNDTCSRQNWLARLDVVGLFVSFLVQSCTTSASKCCAIYDSRVRGASSNATPIFTKRLCPNTHHTSSAMCGRFPGGPDTRFGRCGQRRGSSQVRKQRMQAADDAESAAGSSGRCVSSCTLLFNDIVLHC